MVLVASDDEYNGLYGQQTTPVQPRVRNDYRPISKSTTIAPRTKDSSSNKAPPVQTIRNYSKVNDDGSFTFGYEAADGSFKEETRGTDCVVRGKYGYVDPDGNKREFTYVSGNPCDPNNPEESDEEEPERSEEESNEPENIPQNFPRRPIRPQTPRPIVHSTTQGSPTTVFQNNYAHQSINQEQSEEEEEQPQQIIQHQRQRVTPRPRPQYEIPQEVEIGQRPQRVQLIATTPSPVSITPRPAFRAPSASPKPQLPATTYRPSYHVPVTQRVAPITFDKPVTPSHNLIPSTTRKPIDFAAEFQKFQQEHNIPTGGIGSTTPKAAPAGFKTIRPSVLEKVEPQTSNPIYETQLVYDPNSGQYDSALYQQLPQGDGDFSLNQRIQPYVPPQFVPIDQLQQQRTPIYRQPYIATRPTPTAVPQSQPQQQQFSQQLYRKENDGLQLLNSQQLFAQQQQLAQQQLQADRLSAMRKAQQDFQQAQHQVAHRFNLPQFGKQDIAPSASPDGFYYVQPSPNGQIESFLRGHNIEFK